MARWLGRILIAISLMLSIAVVACWVRSGWVEDRMFGTRGDRYWQITSAGGRVRLVMIEGYPATVSRQWERGPRGGPAETHGEWLVGDRRTLLNPGKSSRALAIEWSEGRAYPGSIRSASWSISRAPVPAGVVTMANVAVPSPVSKAPDAVVASDDPFSSSGSSIPPWLTSTRGPSLAVQPWMTSSPLPAVKAEGASSIWGSAGGTSMAGGGFGQTRAGFPVAFRLVPVPGLGYRSIVVPYWVVVGVAAAPMWIWGLVGWGRWARARRRRRKRLCVKCGYDLRGGGERCPECGELVLGMPGGAADNAGGINCRCAK